MKINVDTRNAKERREEVVIVHDFFLVNSLVYFTKEEINKPRKTKLVLDWRRSRRITNYQDFGVLARSCISLLRPIYTVRLCRIRQAYDMPTS